MLNMAVKEVDETTTPGAYSLPVIRRDGTVERVSFLGMLSVEHARELHNQRRARAVKLDIFLYSTELGMIPRWQPMPDDMALQGCLMQHGVYAVIEGGTPKLVPRAFR